jgi:hypothetical protein
MIKKLPSGKKFSYVGPLIAILHVFHEKYILLFFSPVILVDTWVEMIMPTFSALLSTPISKSIKVRHFVGY